MLLFYQHIHQIPESHLRTYPVEMHGTLSKVVPLIFPKFYEVYQNKMCIYPETLPSILSLDLY